MSYTPFYIASFENDSGLDTSREAFIIPDKAFPTLEDAFAWRGRIRRRDGFELLGRLQRQVTLNQANANGGSTYTVADLLSSVRSSEPNAEITPNTVSITFGSTLYTDDGTGNLVYNSGIYTGSGTINYVTGAIALSFSVNPPNLTAVQSIFFYSPALPVMGLPSYETSTLNQEQLFAFDTKYAYQFNGTSFQEVTSSTPTTWTGSDSQLFWTINYYRNANTNYLLWTTNFNISDPIRYWDTITWTQFNPILRPDSATTPSRLIQARILIPYKGYLIALNTIETNSANTPFQFQQRARWSWNGDPTIIGSVTTGPKWNVIGAWSDDVPGYGGFIDASTNEAIVSVEFVKDILVVKFERSSWKLLFTGDNANGTFLWQKINTELGSESTFSLIPFDRGVFSVGNEGIMVDDTVNVTRIDVRVPDAVFNISPANNGTLRVYGIRDYLNELVFWSYPDTSTSPIFPNKILVYNYRNQTWAIFNDSFTAFGQYQRKSDLTWEELEYENWLVWNQPWNGGQNPSLVVGGNQQGFVEILSQQGSNDQSLAIYAVLPQASPNPVQITVVNHNLQNNQFIKIMGIQGIGSPNPNTLNNTIYQVQVIDANTLSLYYLNGSNEIVPQTLTSGGTYIGGGVCMVLNNINITTKIFSPFYEQGSQVRLGYVDFLFDKTTEGEVTVNLYINENNSIVVNDPNSPQNSNIGLLGDNIVLTCPESADIPYQQNQKKIWHRLYTYAFGQNFQLQITFDDIEMFNEAINDSEVILHAMVLYFSSNARLIQ